MNSQYDAPRISIFSTDVKMILKWYESLSAQRMTASDIELYLVLKRFYQRSL